MSIIEEFHAEIVHGIEATHEGIQHLETPTQIFVRDNLQEIEAYLNCPYLGLSPTFPQALLQEVSEWRNLKSSSQSELAGNGFRGYNWELEWIKRRYDFKAPHYFSTLNVLHTSEVLDALDIRDKFILDIGAGASDILGRHKLKNYVPLDISLEMLKEGRRRWEIKTSIQGSAESLPFSNDSVDAGFMVYSIDRIPNPTAAITEAYRVLKRGGKLIVVNEFPLDSNFTLPDGYSPGIFPDIKYLSEQIVTTGLLFSGWNEGSYVCTDMGKGIEMADCFILVFEKL